ncbi:MAG: sigma-54 dependent transcriptional regulator [bacterium]|nr:sigma-54 dependent transcriptional regulator [bacterium]
MQYTVLIAEDDVTGRETLAEAFSERGYSVVTAEDGRRACEMIEEEDPDVIITDLVLPGVDGMEVLQRASGRCPVILITAHGTIDNAVQAMKAGAFDFVTKPVNLGHLFALVERALQMRVMARENEELRARVRARCGFGEMIGRTAGMQMVFQQIKQVAPTDTTVCIMGESGTGKELVANAIHEHSRRAGKAFVKVNCAAITETLLESELFGHEKGSFTGAWKQRKGRFELADGGTILLDEIAEMSPALQAKLLRVLQEQTFERVGGTETLRVDVRVIVATNADLRERIKQGTFREDLYYRVSVFPIVLPPLRERKEDIPLLVDHFVQEYAAEMRKEFRGISRAAMEKLIAYEWPGNIRQLQNAVERACVMAPCGGMIEVEHLPPEVVAGERIGEVVKGSGSVELPHATMDELERMAIEQALVRCGWNRTAAARMLNIGTKTLYRKMERYGIREKK